MTKAEFEEAFFECATRLQAVDGYVMRALPRSEWIVRMCGDDAIQVGAWIHMGAIYWRKIKLLDLPKYFIGLNDLEALRVKHVD